MQKIIRRRALRSFVKSVQKRSTSASEKGLAFLDTTTVRKKTRLTSAQMQELRAIVRKAEFCIRKGDLQSVEELYIQALTIQPDSPDVQAGLAKLYLETGREHKAEALYKELLIQSDDPTFFANLGLAFYRQHKFDAACEAYKKALEKDPGSPERNLNVGRAFIAIGNSEEAIPYLEKASIRLWKDHSLLLMLAQCYEELGETKQAYEAYKKINRLQPYNEEVKQKIQELSTL